MASSFLAIYTTLFLLVVFLPHRTYPIDSDFPKYSPSDYYSEPPESISIPPSEALASISLPPSEAPLSPFPALPTALPPSPLSPSPPAAPTPTPSSPPSPEDDEDPPSDHEDSPPPMASGGVQHAYQSSSAAADVEAEDRPSRPGMKGGKKAGVAIGVIAAAGGVLVLLGAMVYKKRQHNIQRSQYGHYARTDYL